MHGVVEAPGYLKQAEAIFTLQERETILMKVAHNSECGEMMQSTGGVRKRRIGRGSRGKSGGGRVVYFCMMWIVPSFCSRLFQDDKSNMSEAERNEIAKFVKTLFKLSEGNV